MSPTISLFKIKDGDCIGGYTSAKWKSDNKTVVDNDAILFNLSRQRKFLNSKEGFAIYGGSKRGPFFNGEAYPELAAWSEPFNGKLNCISYANKPGYNIPIEGAKNMLTN